MNIWLKKDLLYLQLMVEEPITEEKIFRKQAPAPERVVTGTGRSSGAVDSTLERLREEAARTGNMSKVVAYKRQKKA
jgi:hypothetical protein